jgi:signal transduction histidine kinase/CheY-like chemotaxis protein
MEIVESFLRNVPNKPEKNKNYFIFNRTKFQCEFYPDSMKKIVNLNTYFKLLLLIFGTSILFFLLYLSLYAYTMQQEKHVYKSTYDQYTNEVTSLVELNSNTHTASIIDVTFWDELVKFTKTKDPKWFKRYIIREFNSYEVDYIAIYDINNEFITKTATPKLKTVNFIPKEILPQLYKSKFIRFYMRVPEGIIEVFGATIHPSNDPKKNKSLPSGYFFMAKLLDNDYFTKLEKISSSKITFANDAVNTAEDDTIATRLPLKDWKNREVAQLLFKRPFNLNFKNTKEILLIIIIASIFNILIYLYYSRRWVYTPLKLITKVLETGNESAISNLKTEPGEFGYIGNLFEENTHQRKQLEISKRKAEESDKLKSSFLANLSHEIRTPMNAIIGFSDLLSNPNLTEADKADYLKIIRNSGTNLVSIIEDLIEMSKIDAKQITPKFRGFDVTKFITEIYETINITIPEEKKIVFSMQHSGELIQKKILSDEVKLKQVINNLVTNAIKYTDNGFVTFGYQVNKQQQTLEFIVKDSGIGIDPDNLKVIFDRFRRIEDDFSAELSGLGLGLAISKAYVEMLGGHINVSSKVGQGSVFSFTIPLKFDESEEIIPSGYSINCLESNSHKTILIAEDDNINYLLLKKILQIKNFTVIRAVNGQEAVTIAEENINLDLIFMDIKMPVMDGYKAFEKINSFRPHLPIVAQTAHSSNEDRERIIRAGFTDYITKPLDKEKIFELLDEVFSKEVLR